MTFDFHDYKLTSGDLSSSFIEQIEEALETRIREDAELIKEIEQYCKEESAEDIGGKLELVIDDMIAEAVNGLRIYCDFDMEVML